LHLIKAAKPEKKMKADADDLMEAGKEFLSDLKEQVIAEAEEWKSKATADADVKKDTES